MNCLTNISLYRKCFVVLAISSLSACSFIYGEDGLIKDTSYDYTKATNEKELAIPTNLSQKNKADYAVVPEISDKTKNSLVGRELLIKSPVQILDVLENIRVDKLAENPAVFIQDDRNFIWQTLIEYFDEHSIKPSVIDKDAQVIDTGWLAVDDRGLWLGVEGSEEIDEYRAKYLFTLWPGTIKGETKLEVKRVAAQKLNEDTDQWQDVPSTWEDSAQMLNIAIINYDQKYTTNELTKKANSLAGFQVELGADAENNAAFITAEKKETVWNALPKVLEAAKFEISDKDRRSMTYFLEYKENEPGFFASLFTSKEESLPIEYANYQVILSDLGELTAITFNDAQGKPLESSIVVKMYPFLSSFFGTKQ